METWRSPSESGCCWLFNFASCITQWRLTNHRCFGENTIAVLRSFHQNRNHYSVFPVKSLVRALYRIYAEMEYLLLCGARVNQSMVGILDSASSLGTIIVGYCRWKASAKWWRLERRPCSFFSRDPMNYPMNDNQWSYVLALFFCDFVW